MRQIIARLFASKKPAEEAYSSARLLEQQGLLSQYNPSDLVGKQGMRIFSKMRKDDQVKAALKFKKNAVLAPGWTIKAPKSAGGDSEPQRFTQYCFDNIDGTFDGDLRDILTAMEYGYSVSEKLYATVESGEWAGKLRLAAIKGKQPSTFGFDQDTFGNLRTLYQSDGYRRKPLTISKFIIWSFQSEFGNLYGESDLEAAYPAWWSKVNAYKWMAMSMEKMAIPPLIALFNSTVYNEQNQAKLQTLLARLQANSVGTIPRPSKDDLELWTPEAKLSFKEIFVVAITMYNQDIARALLVPGLLGMTADTETGSYARSETHFMAFELVVEEIRRELAEVVINEQIIRPLVDLNFAGIDDYPYFEFLPVTSDKRGEILSTWKDMLAARAVTPQDDDEEHIRAMLEFPERSEDEPVKPDLDTEDDPAPSPAPPSGSTSPVDGGNGSGRVYSFATRAPTKYEKKVDFKAIVDTLDAREEAAKARLRAAMARAQSAVAKKVKASFDSDPYALLEKLEFARPAEIRRAISDLVDDAYIAGRRSIAPGQFRDALPAVEAKEAIKWLRAKKIEIAGVLLDRVMAEIRAAITESIRAGDTTQDAIERINRILEPYTGDDAVLKDGEPLKPHRVETITRTVTTQAYNIGRLVQIRQNPLVAGVQYSAIIDERTTEVCKSLDGKIFRTGDSDLDALTPPNHFRCRSLLVPVMIDEQPDDDEFISPTQIGAAREKAGKGFV